MLHLHTGTFGVDLWLVFQQCIVGSRVQIMFVGTLPLNQIKRRRLINFGIFSQSLMEQKYELVLKYFMQQHFLKARAQSFLFGMHYSNVSIQIEKNTRLEKFEKIVEPYNRLRGPCKAQLNRGKRSVHFEFQPFGIPPQFPLKRQIFFVFQSHLRQFPRPPPLQPRF